MNKLTVGLQSHCLRSGPRFVCFCCPPPAGLPLNFRCQFKMGQKHVIGDIAALAIVISARLGVFCPDTGLNSSWVTFSIQRRSSTPGDPHPPCAQHNAAFCAQSSSHLQLIKFSLFRSHFKPVVSFLSTNEYKVKTCQKR